MFFDENAEYIFPVSGYMSPGQLEVFLKVVGTNDYKNIKSQQEFQTYQNKFKGTFKE